MVEYQYIVFDFVLEKRDKSRTQKEMIKKCSDRVPNSRISIYKTYYRFGFKRKKIIPTIKIGINQ
jgi:hypothetical protein